jgi:type II restriction/modification system DNA methylase subunit YeeA
MNHLTIRKTLNKAFLKVKPQRSEINHFKGELRQLLTQINPAEHEEFNKNLLSDFLKNTFYAANHFINTKGRNDLVIHHEKSPKSAVGVIIEAKRPENVAEMPTKDNLNAKAIQELVLYYLRERITDGNDKIKHLIATDAHVWFVFDEQEFFKHFGNDKKLVKTFEEFERGTASGTKTDYFYKNIAQPAIEKVQNDIAFTYFDIREFKNIVEADDKELDKKLIPLFKIFSPEHLLKLPFANDSNTLDKSFYNELLHLIGLYETSGSKKTIERLPKGKRNAGSLLENTIEKLDSTNKIHRLKNAKKFGATNSEQLESVALELVITWINRILFLKLLEAQLLSYHKGDKTYAFLNFEKLQDYDEVEVLFFEILAKETKDRSAYNQETFGKVPYLNSSLFEPTELENETIEISGLRDRYDLPIFPSTVLKDTNGKRLTGGRNTLDYLLAFLDAYDFASEGTEDVQEQHKSIINAAVLGLIFEKINGYKDGSFFTPGFITMYMCRETLRRAVVQKFNEANGWNCENITELYNQIRDRKAANELMNTLKICDPAVGSGHFLVSALNELIAIKYDLGILQDENGKGFRDFRFEIENDELVVWDEQEDQLFKYNPNGTESKRIQKMLFHEKQTIIENCLFGVDINPNSVKICRLRLWIELLKNAYYKTDGELETLPNIDINIKCGNSLISRFALDADLKAVLKTNKSKWDILSYRNAVALYRNAKDKAKKWEMLDFINSIKNDFQQDIYLQDPKNKQLKKLLGEKVLIENRAAIGDLFEKLSDKDIEQDLSKISRKINQLEQEINDTKNNIIYQNAFEWRFEFPEVLNEEGDFVGFDVVIGNPPYFQIQFSSYSNNNYLKKYATFEKTGDIYSLFFERATSIIKTKGLLSYITSNRFCNTNYGLSTRAFLAKFNLEVLININDIDVFEEANVGTFITILSNQIPSENISCLEVKTFKQLQNLENSVISTGNVVESKFMSKNPWLLITNKELSLLGKIGKIGKPLSIIEDLTIQRGLTTGANKIFVIENELGEKLLRKNPKNSDLIKPVLKGAEIKRYLVKDYSNYIILTKTDVNIQEYPDVYKYLLENKIALEKVYEARKEMKEWYELRKCSYYDLFEDRKLIWTRLANINSFTISTNKEYSIDSTSFATGNNLEYYCGLLNSKLVFFYFKYGSVIWGKDGIKWFGNHFNSIPILPFSNSERSTNLINLVTEILAQKQADPKADTSELETAIDALVYELYDLTAAEIALIEKG